MGIEGFYTSLSDEDYRMLEQYLHDKKASSIKQNRFNVVFDLLHQCNFNCIGCGTNANYSEDPMNRKHASIEDLERACKKISEYAEQKHMKVFINLGGGEPFFRNDIQDVIRLFYSYFGPDGVGIDTNGTMPEFARKLTEVADCLSYIGISVNGLKDYHNWWSGREKFNPYDRTMHALQQLCCNEKISEKIEVTSIATRKNLNQIPLLIEELLRVGVRKYSIHRAIPVGRMLNNLDLIPSSSEYFQLLLDLIKIQNNTGMDVHLHHSIENIHRAILFNDNTYSNDKIGDKNDTSSIGISANGEVVFDAWCMTGKWLELSCGNIFDENISLSEMLDKKDTYFYKACKASRGDFRCRGCNKSCSGGSRVVAATTELAIKREMAIDSISSDELIEAFGAVDPACPRYKRKEEGVGK